MHFFDSHSHLSSAEMLPNITGVMERAAIVGVDRVVNICTDRTTLTEGLKLGQRYLQLVHAGATTPHDVEKEGEADFPVFEEAARSQLLVAVGETGLDYHYEHSNREIQKKFLKKYLKLAAEVHLPVIFHCREAFADLFAIVDDHYPEGAPAILHCFTGTVPEAEEVWKRGWYLSLSGIVTYKKSDSLREVAKAAPLDQILIETDAPFLAPQSKRGRTNEPGFIVETAKCIAEVRGISLEQVAKSTWENGRRVFQLSN